MYLLEKDGIVSFGRGRKVDPMKFGKLEFAGGTIVWNPSLEHLILNDGVLTSDYRPLFEGYLLFGHPLGWKNIEDEMNIRLVRGGKFPLEFTSANIEWIEEMERSTIYGPQMTFQNGEKVRVKLDARSSYAGMIGKYIMSLINSKNQFISLIELDLCGVRTECVKVFYDQLESIRDISTEKEIVEEKCKLFSDGMSNVAPIQN